MHSDDRVTASFIINRYFYAVNISAQDRLLVSGSAKLCGSTYTDPRGKISIKNGKKKFFFTQIWTIEKREVIKISWFLNGWSSFNIKISEKIEKNFENSALLKKNSVNIK